jgi:hypothetical protein
MSGIAILGLVVLLIAAATALGLRPKGGRPAAPTHLMTAARVILVLVGLVLLYVGLRH